MSRLLLGVTGGAGAIVAWWAAVALPSGGHGFLAQFSPIKACAALPGLVTDEHLLTHVLMSLQRVGVGLALALVAGLPLGFALGRSQRFASLFAPTLQFLRMISPLSWMPLAVISLGIGERAIYFLLAFAAVWPLAMSTAAGVAQIDRRWVQLGTSLAATRLEMLWHVYVPGVAAHVLTGVRLAIGILWIVLVPAEMLGVSSGLGYLILDARDRLAYPDLTAAVVVIGALGFALDCAARLLRRLAGGAAA
ncbi:MAG: ABC transporter permease [Burkholderiaceae bacterium]|jgi:NitT/TauT family transport system permease protein|nr:ABC transporter permease [Burkholderiaceae bacterium]